METVSFFTLISQMGSYYASHFVDAEMEAQEGGCPKSFSKVGDETKVINQVSWLSSPSCGLLCLSLGHCQHQEQTNA